MTSSELDWLGPRLTQLLDEHGVPGGSVGVLTDAGRHVAVAGVESVETGVHVVPETAFQIGSNTKAMTATLVAALLDQGRLGLDSAVRELLPGTPMGTPDRAGDITVGQLLTHTSGLLGDNLGTNACWGDHAVECYVSELARVPMIHEPGELWSYCNTGWVVLGRILEVLHGRPYRVVLRECLLDPLGMASTTTALHEVLSRRHASGHVVGADGTAQLAPVYATMPAYVPGGSQTVSTATDMLRFLALHRDLGRTTDGKTVLSEPVARLMQQPHVKVPDVGPDDAWGLGFALGHTSDGRRTIGHGGRTPSQVADMLLLPEDGLAVVVLTNSTAGGPVARTLIPEIVAELTDTSLPDPMPERSGSLPALHLDRYAGTYVHGGTSILVSVSAQQLVAEAEAASLMPGSPALRVSTPLEAVDEVRFRTLAGPAQVIAFDQVGLDGRPEILFAAGRIHRRTDPDMA